VKSLESFVSKQMNITSHEEFQNNIIDKIIEELENDYKDTKFAMHRHIAEKIR
jgi:hypothetical protein